MKIATKLLLGTLIPTGLLAWVGHHASGASEGSLRAAIERASAARAAAVADEIDRVVASRVAECLSYSRSPLLQQTTEQSNKTFEIFDDPRVFLEKREEEWLGGREEADFVRAIEASPLTRELEARLLTLDTRAGDGVFLSALVTNRHGAVVATSELPATYSQMREPWWTAARLRGVHVGQLRYDDALGVYCTDICVAIVEDDGTTGGVLKAVMNAGELIRILDERSVDPHSGVRSRLYLFDGERRLIHRGGVGVGKPFQDGSRWFDVRQHNPNARIWSAVRRDPIDGIDYLSTYARSRGAGAFGGLGWTVLLELEEELVASPIATLRADIQIATGAAAFFVLLIGGLISYTTSKRLRDLRYATVAMGQGDFEVQVRDVSRDELGQLGAFFNEMGRKLKASATALQLQTESAQRKNRELEAEIEVRKEVERQLTEAKEASESAERAKSEFLANVSHEIRTPMNGIIGMTGFLMESDLQDEQRSYAKSVSTCAESLLSLINDILDFSKIEAGKLELEDLPFDLERTVDEVVDIIASKAAEKGLELVTDLSPDVPRYLRGDPGRLRQILLNLVNNSIKFTNEGEVVIRVLFDGAQGNKRSLRFVVEDTGIGIPSDRLPSLFQSFSQVDASTTRKYGGTGLGLAISKRLVELMEGEIGVESREGEGSTFWFRVAMDARATPTTVRRHVPDLRGRRVLIVDDNATNREVAGRILSSWRLDPVLLDGPEKVLDTLREAVAEDRPFDLVVLDYQMPGEDGLSVGRKIITDPELGAVPVILLTSIDGRGGATRARKLGFGAYLTKPIKQSQLFDSVIEVLGAGPKGARDLDSLPSLLPALPLRELRVLVAEDNVINQKVVERLLSKIGVEAVIVSNGREALEAVEANDYDVVLMDCQMPEMDGFEAVRAIRALDGPKADLTVVALTAHAMKGDRELCLAAGMDDYLSKPVTIDSLRDALQRVEVKRPDAQQQT